MVGSWIPSISVSLGIHSQLCGTVQGIPGISGIRAWAKALRFGARYLVEVSVSQGAEVRVREGLLSPMRSEGERMRLLPVGNDMESNGRR
jgi:hypothetical protein